MNKLKAWFWRNAQKRHQFNPPGKWPYYLAFWWTGFWTVFWVVALIAEPTRLLPIVSSSLFWIGIPLTYGLAKRAVHREYSSGGHDALYRKWLSYSGD